MPAQRGASIAISQDEFDNREFVLTDQDFQSLSALAYEQAGIVLSDSKRSLLYSRVSRRLRALGMRAFSDYWTYLSTHPDEIESFINSISTNHTHFFREAHHFDHFRDHVVQPFAAACRAQPGQRLRIWCAASSTGEEPYTIASVLRRDIRDPGRHDARILATDIDTQVLAKAERGVYPAASLDAIPDPYREFMRVTKGARDSSLVMGEELKSLLTFKRLNLIGPWPFKGPFDAIFCRNVLIYFDAPTKSALIDRFVQYLKPGGWLYLGHAESIMRGGHGLQLAGRTTYRRPA